MADRPLMEALVRLRADGSVLQQEAVSEASKAAKQASAATEREITAGYRKGVTAGGKSAAAEAGKSGAAAGTAYSTALTRATDAQLKGPGKLVPSGSQAAREAEQAGTAVGRKFGAKASTAIGEELKAQAGEIGKGFVAAVAVERYIGFVRDAVSVASDLNEAGSALNVTFGRDGATAIQQWSESTAKGFGLARLEAVQANAQFGIFAKSAGLAGTQATDFSTRLTGLAGDLTSFYNPAGGTQQAIEAIGAALRGETEPIRAFGVLLDDATLRQEALRLGLVKTTKDALTPQQRVLAAYSQIVKQTSDAQGDFARTSDSLANSQRTLTNNLQDTKAQIGEALLPTVQTATSGLKSLLETYNKIPNEGVAGRLKLAALGTPGALSAADQTIRDFGQTVADGLKRTATAADQSGKAVSSQWAQYDRLAHVQIDTASSTAAVAAATSTATVAASENAAAMNRAGLAAIAHADGVRKAAGSSAAQAAAAASAAAASRTLTKVYDGSAEKARVFASEQKRLNDSLLQSPYLEGRASLRAYEQALDDASAAARENGKTLNDGTQKGRDNAEALDRLAESSLAYLSTINKQKGPGREFNDALARQRTDLIRAGRAFGLSRDEARKYADRILKIPKTASTRVRLAGVQTANYQLDTLLTRINSLGRKIQVYSSAANVREDRTAASTGGPVPGLPSEVDTEPYLLAPGEFVVRAREASKPENRRVLEAMNRGVAVSELASAGGGGVSAPAASIDADTIASAVTRGVVAAMQALGPGVVKLGDAVVGEFVRAGGRVSGVQGAW